MRVALFGAVGFVIAVGGCAGTGKTAAPEIRPVERIVDNAPREEAGALLQAGRYGEAEIAFRTVLLSEPENVEARYGLAESLRLGGNPQASRAEYLTVAEAPGWRSRALEGLGQANLLAGDHNGAYEAFASAVNADPTAWRAWLGLAQLRDLARDWANADAAYASARAAAPEMAIIHNNQGVSMLARGKSEEAAELFRKALALDQTFDRARTNLELANASRSVSVESVVAGEPDAQKRAQKLNNYGYVAMLQGRLEEAGRYLEAAIDAHPAFYAVAYENLKVLKAMQAGAQNK